MTTQTEALKLALEALEICYKDCYIPVRLTREAIIAVKEALAQPEQKPVAHSVVEPLRHDEYQRRVSVKWVNQPVAGPLYITPPQSKEPEQEPVAHTAVFHCPNCEYPHRQVTHITGVAQPPWSPQRTWVGLTDKELQDVWPFVFRPHELRNKAIYQAIEAKLKEKNT